RGSRAKSTGVRSGTPGVRRLEVARRGPEEMIRWVVLLVLLGCSEPPKPGLEIGPTDNVIPAERAERLRMAEDRREKLTRWVGAASSDDCRRPIRPLLEREQIPYVPWAKSLGMTEFGSDTPENARRARALVEADAHRNGYYFVKGIDAPP